jgi:hypothetical protein
VSEPIRPISSNRMAVEHDSEKRAAQRREAAHRTYGLLAGIVGDRCLYDELIAARREEARRDASADRSAPPRA